MHRLQRLMQFTVPIIPLLSYYKFKIVHHFSVSHTLHNIYNVFPDTVIFTIVSLSIAVYDFIHIIFREWWICFKLHSEPFKNAWTYQRERQNLLDLHWYDKLHIQQDSRIIDHFQVTSNYLHVCSFTREDFK